MVDFIYDGYVNMNYNNARRRSRAADRTDALAHTVCIVACSCAFVEYLLCSVGRLAVSMSVVARAAHGRSKMAIEAIDYTVSFCCCCFAVEASIAGRLKKWLAHPSPLPLKSID